MPKFGVFSLLKRKRYWAIIDFRKRFFEQKSSTIRTKVMDWPEWFAAYTFHPVKDAERDQISSYHWEFLCTDNSFFGEKIKERA